jgi:hypothetical protein
MTGFGFYCNSFASASGGANAVCREVVLVVDDEPAILRLIAEVLEKQGYASIGASDGPSRRAFFHLRPGSIF